nr:hypothetical protein B0A51_00038 [Rachicladosporium sp. CCFEE 5018]
MFCKDPLAQSRNQANALQGNDQAPASNDNVPPTSRTEVSRSVLDKPLPPDPPLESKPSMSRITPATSAPATLRQSFPEIPASFVPTRRKSVGLMERGWVAQESRGIQRLADWEAQCHVPSPFEAEVHSALEEVAMRCRKEQGGATDNERRRRRWAVGYGGAYRVEERSSPQRRGSSYTTGDDPSPDSTSFGVSKQRTTVPDDGGDCAGNSSPSSCSTNRSSASDFLPHD